MTRNSYVALMHSGVRIYEYTNGFIHSKNVLSDDAYAVVGTINFDYRSLVHHFEDAVWMYQTNAIANIKADFINTFEMSSEIESDGVRMNILQKILRDLIRLFAPML